MADVSALTIGVLLGGVSNEREISLISGAEVAAALRRKSLSVKELDVTSSDEYEMRTSLGRAQIDLAFIALHGSFGEDGEIQKLLDTMEIPYTGSSPCASSLAMDKVASKRIFQEYNIATPPFTVYDKDSPLSQPQIFPVVVKPSGSGSSLGVTIVWQSEDFKKAIERALECSHQVLIEEYIEGREVTVGVLDRQALEVVEIVPKNGFYDFRTKYTDGCCDFIVPADFERTEYSRIQSIALQAHKALGCSHFSRVDLRVDRQGVPFVLEVNSIPGFTSHSLLPISAKARGINFDELCYRIVEFAYIDVTKETKTV